MFRIKSILYIVFIIVSIAAGSIIRYSNLWNTGSYFDLIITQYSWGKAQYDMGFLNFWTYYDKTFDYMPGAMSLSWFVYMITYNLGGNEQTFVTLIKVFNWFWDIVLCFIIYRFAQQNETLNRIKTIALASLAYIVPSLWSVSAVWGQMDSFIVVFGLIAFIFYFYSDQMPSSFVFGKRLLNYHNYFPYFTGFFLAMGYWVKPTVLLILPLILILLFNRKDWRSLWKLFITFLLSSIPFIIVPICTNPDRLISILALPVFGFGVNSASRDAANLWYLIGLEGYSGQNIISFGSLNINVFMLAISICTIWFFAFMINYLRLSSEFTFSNLFKYEWWVIFFVRFFGRKITILEITILGVIINYLYFIFYIKMHSRYLMMGMALSLILLVLWDKAKDFNKLLLLVLITHFAFFLNQIAIVNNNIPWVKYFNEEIFKFNYINLAAVLYISSWIFMSMIFWNKFKEQ